MGELHAHRRGQAIAHRAEAAGGHPPVRLVEMEILRRPHLVLADLRRDEALAALGELLQPLESVLGLDDLGRVLVGERLARPPAVDLQPPGLERRLVDLSGHVLPQPHHVLEHMGAVADDADVHLDVLVDGRGSMSMWIFFEPGEKASIRPVMRSSKARADVHHQVAAMHGEVRLVGAVHAEHAQPLRVMGRIGAEAHQGEVMG